MEYCFCPLPNSLTNKEGSRARGRAVFKEWRDGIGYLNYSPWVNYPSLHPLLVCTRVCVCVCKHACVFTQDQYLTHGEKYLGFPTTRCPFWFDQSPQCSVEFPVVCVNERQRGEERMEKTGGKKGNSVLGRVCTGKHNCNYILNWWQLHSSYESL